jgi:hypothetical protein
MPLEKCHFCTYAAGDAVGGELVIERCAHHAANWDPTIENQEARAAWTGVLEAHAATTAAVIEANARCPYCAPNILCNTHASVVHPHVDVVAPEPPQLAFELPEAEPCPDCILGIICAKHMGLDRTALARRPYIAPAITSEREIADEAPKTPRDQSARAEEPTRKRRR